MSKTGDKRWHLNRQHWTENLDVQNLKDSSAEDDLRVLLDLFETADVRKALAFLEPMKERLVVDLGGGLGLMAILIARRGGTALIADLSLPRLRKARELARQAGVEDRLLFVQCTAEELPFLENSVTGEITKSVLIHTDLPRAAAELSRVLAPDGRAAFIEPLSRNPLVNLYRRLAAPKIWQSITTYFSPQSIRLTANPFRSCGRRVRVDRLYFLGFLAGVFNYLVKAPRLYRILEKAFLALDDFLFFLAPGLRKNCWFCLIKIESTKPDGAPNIRA